MTTNEDLRSDFARLSRDKFSVAEERQIKGGGGTETIAEIGQRIRRNHS